MPSVRSTAPAAIRAVTCPSEWPAKATGGSGSLGASASHATRESVRVAIWAASVLARASAGASSSKGATGRLAIPSTSSTTDHAAWPAQGAPAPGTMDP
jgi:hypothetical protein